MEVKTDFQDPEKGPFPRNRGVLLIEVTDTKIMWKFFCEQLLGPVIGGALE